MAGKIFTEKDWKSELKNGAEVFYRSIHKALDLPSCGRFDSGKFERTDKDQPRSSCIWGIGAIAAETCEKYCDGVVGDGTFDQLQHYLYDEYETKNMGDSGTWCVWVCQCISHCDVCIFETYFFKEIEEIQ